jgi:hypothetical protein
MRARWPSSRLRKRATRLHGLSVRLILPRLSCGHKLSKQTFVAWMTTVSSQFKATLERAVAADIERLSGSCADILEHERALWTFVERDDVEPTSPVGDRRGGRLDHASPDCFSPLGRLSRSSRSSSPFPAPATSTRTGGFPASGSPRGCRHTGVISLLCSFIAKSGMRWLRRVCAAALRPLARTPWGHRLLRRCHW